MFRLLQSSYLRWKVAEHNTMGSLLGWLWNGLPTCTIHPRHLCPIVSKTTRNSRNLRTGRMGRKDRRAATLRAGVVAGTKGRLVKPLAVLIGIKDHLTLMKVWLILSMSLRVSMTGAQTLTVEASFWKHRSPRCTTLLLKPCERYLSKFSSSLTVSVNK